MSKHVDLVKHDIVNDKVILGAQVYPLADGIRVESRDGEDWDFTVRQHSFDDGALTAQSDPVGYLSRLHEVINNTYWHATELHDAAVCSFGGGHRCSRHPEGYLVSKGDRQFEFSCGCIEVFGPLDE